MDYVSCMPSWSLFSSIIWYSTWSVSFISRLLFFIGKNKSWGRRGDLYHRSDRRDYPEVFGLNLLYRWTECYQSNHPSCFDLVVLRDYRWEILWTSRLYRLLGWWYAVVSSFSMLNNLHKSVKTFPTSCLPLSVRFFTGQEYMMILKNTSTTSFAVMVFIGAASTQLVKWSTQTKIYLYPFFEHFIDPKMSIPNNSNSKWLSWNDRFQKTIWKRLVAFVCRRLPSHNNHDAFHSSRIVFVLHRKVFFESSVQE